MTPYCKIDHVEKTFKRGKIESNVLKDITLEVAKGEYVTIIGHSGCGKSTLFNIVAGLAPATEGGVILEGRQVNEPGPGSRGRFPEPQPAAVAHGLRQRPVGGGQGVFAREIPRRTP